MQRNIFEPRKYYKPFEYNDETEPFINAIWASHWTHNEFNFKSDIQEFKTELSKEEQEVIKRAVLLISQIEVSVKSYWSNLHKIIQKPEIADVGAVFGGNEVIHSRAYSQILNVLGLDGEFQKILSEGIVSRRVEYLSKYVNKIYKNDRKNILYSLILFTLFTEKTSLFSQFYIILGFNRYKNILKDVSNIVNYTSKEEEIHAQFGITLINTILTENPELLDSELISRIIEESNEALLAEEGLVEWMLQGYENDFLTKDKLMTFIKVRMNDCLNRINIDYQFEVSNDLVKEVNWMEEEILAPAMTDFFNKKPIDYAKKNKTFNEEDLF